MVPISQRNVRKMGEVWRLDRHIVFSPECERRELEGEKLWPALNMS